MIFEETLLRDMVRSQPIQTCAGTGRGKSPVIGSGRQMLKVFGIVSTFALGVSACGEPKPGDRVKVYPPWQFNVTDSDAPVITHLYKYEHGVGSGIDFRIKGDPLSFKFPAKFYGLRENQRGGPQWEVNLLVDRTNMQPLSDFLSRSYKRFGAYEPSAIYQRFSLRDLSIAVRSQAGIAYLPKQITPSLINRRGFRRLDSYCGFIMYGTKAGNVGFSSAEQRLPGTLGQPELLGITNYGQSQLSVSCDPSSPICIVSFLYREHEVSFKEPKGSVCKAAADRRRIIDLLDRYIL